MKHMTRWFCIRKSGKRRRKIKATLHRQLIHKNANGDRNRSTWLTFVHTHRPHMGKQRISLSHIPFSLIRAQANGNKILREYSILKLQQRHEWFLVSFRVAINSHTLAHRLLPNGAEVMLESLSAPKKKNRICNVFSVAHAHIGMKV